VLFLGDLQLALKLAVLKMISVYMLFCNDNQNWHCSLSKWLWLAFSICTNFSDRTNENRVYV